MTDVTVVVQPAPSLSLTLGSNQTGTTLDTTVNVAATQQAAVSAADSAAQAATSATAAQQARVAAEAARDAAQDASQADGAAQQAATAAAASATQAATSATQAAASANAATNAATTASHAADAAAQAAAVVTTETADQLGIVGVASNTDDVLLRRGQEVMRLSMSALLTYLQGQWSSYLMPRVTLAAPATITAGHNGKVLVVTNSGTLTFADGLSDGFTCDIVNANITETVTMVAPTGESIVGMPPDLTIAAGSMIRFTRLTVAGTPRFQALGGGSGGAGGTNYALTVVTPASVSAGQSITLSGKYSDPLDGTIEYSSNQIDWAAGVTPSGGAYTFTVTGLPQGYQRLYVRLSSNVTTVAQTGVFAVGDGFTANPSALTLVAGSLMYWSGLTTRGANHYAIGVTFQGSEATFALASAPVAAGGTWRIPNFQVPAKSGTYTYAWKQNTITQTAVVTITVTPADNAVISPVFPPSTYGSVVTNNIPVTGYWGGVTTAPATIEHRVYDNNYVPLLDQVITTTRTYTSGSGQTLYEGTFAGTVPARPDLPLPGGWAYNVRAKNASGGVIATGTAIGIS